MYACKEKREREGGGGVLETENVISQVKGQGGSIAAHSIYGQNVTRYATLCLSTN